MLIRRAHASASRRAEKAAWARSAPCIRFNARAAFAPALRMTGFDVPGDAAVTNVWITTMREPAKVQRRPIPRHLVMRLYRNNVVYAATAGTADVSETQASETQASETQASETQVGKTRAALARRNGLCRRGYASAGGPIS
jgi:hypothetical protein